MTRAAIILALCLPAMSSAATMPAPDLVMSIVDGMPMFRPVDGLDCYDAKFGGILSECSEIDAVPATSPRPCYRSRPWCATGGTYSQRASGGPVRAAVPDIWRNTYAGTPVFSVPPLIQIGCCATTTPPPIIETPSPVPLPASGLMLLCAALGLSFFRRKPL